MDSSKELGRSATPPISEGIGSDLEMARRQGVEPDDELMSDLEALNNPSRIDTLKSVVKFAFTGADGMDQTIDAIERARTRATRTH